MIRQGYKRILIIGMVLILLFSCLMACDDREEATTPAATTPAESTTTTQSQAPLSPGAFPGGWSDIPQGDGFWQLESQH